MSDTYSTNIQHILSDALTSAGIEHIQNHCLDGYHFNFAFPGHKLIVEVDSNKYSGNLYKKAEQKADDQQRDARLNQLGYQVIRYSNQAVKNSTKGVVLSIQRHLLACQAQKTK